MLNKQESIPTIIYIDFRKLATIKIASNEDYKAIDIGYYMLPDALQLFQNLNILERGLGVTLCLREENISSAEIIIDLIDKWCQIRFIQSPLFRQIILDEVTPQNQIKIKFINRSIIRFSNQETITLKQLDQYMAIYFNQSECTNSFSSNSTAAETTNNNEQIQDESIHSDPDNLEEPCYPIPQEGHQTNLGGPVFIKCSSGAIGHLNSQQIYVKPDLTLEIKELICIQIYRQSGVLTPEYRLTKDHPLPRQIQKQYKHIPFIDQPIDQLEIHQLQKPYEYFNQAYLQQYQQSCSNSLKIKGKEVRGLGRAIAVAEFIEDPYLLGEYRDNEYAFDNLIIKEQQQYYQVGILQAEDFFVGDQLQFGLPLLKPNLLNEKDMAEYDEVKDGLINGSILRQVEEKLQYISHKTLYQELMSLIRDKVERLKNQLIEEQKQPPQKSILSRFAIESSSSDSD